MGFCNTLDRQLHYLIASLLNVPDGWREHFQEHDAEDPITCGTDPEGHTAIYNALEYYMDIVPTDPQSNQGKGYYYHKMGPKNYCLVSELERTDDPDYENGDPVAISNKYDGCNIYSSCGKLMRTPHYVVTNP